MATPSPGGTLLGAAQLQNAIDNLTLKVQALTQAVNGLLQSGSVTGNGNTNWRQNPSGSGSNTTNAPLFPRPQAPPPPPNAPNPYGYTPRHAAPYTSPAAANTPGNLPPPGPKPLLNQIAGFGPGNGRLTGQAATIGGALGALYSAARTFGQAQFSNQVGMNAYAQQASLMAPTNMTFGQINAQLYNQAFGGNGNTPWAIANNAMDAAQGQLILNSAAGTAFPNSTAQGRNMMQATGMFGYVNPTLGLTGAANMTAQLYNPQTSMMMRALGYPVTPRVLGRPGQTNTAGAVIQGMMQRMYSGRTHISQKQLAANLTPGQTGFIDLQQVFGSNASAWATAMEAQNRALNKGMTASQFGNLLNQAVQNKGGAQQTLAKRGILDTSDLQSIKDLGAQRTARASDYSTTYNQALQTSTALLTQFNKQLSQILDQTGLNKPIGWAGGATATLHNLTQMGSSGLAIGGGIALGKALLGGGTSGGAAGTAAGKVGGLLGKTPIGGMGAGGVATAGAAGGVGMIVGGILHALGDSVARAGTSSGAVNAAVQTTNNPIATAFGGFAGRMANMIGMLGGSGPQPALPQAQGTNKNTKNNGGSPSGAAVDAVHVAERYLGTPYVYGGSNPSTGFDCSGLVQYAYGQAGIKLPRTSEEQWAYLRKKAVSNKNAREGDIVFMAGADGTPNNPGHEGLMVSSTQLIQAPYTGADVQIIRYDPSQWSHVARPTGPLTGGGKPGAGSTGAGGTLNNTASPLGGVGNTGAGFNSSEVSALQTGGEMAALGGGGPASGMSNFGGSPTNSLVNSGGPTSRGAGSGATSKGLTGNKKIMNDAAAKYGWGTGSEWSNLYALEMAEAGFNNLAQNPTSTAFGMGQFLDSTWATVGGTKTTNPYLQSKYMMEYIKMRYKDPIHAEAHERQYHWYAKGTANAYRGVALVGDQGPELISLRGGENIANANQTSSILNNRQMPCVNITVEKGAINVHGGAGTAHDAGNSGREIVKQFLTHLSAENIYAAIGVGSKL